MLGNMKLPRQTEQPRSERILSLALLAATAMTAGLFALAEPANAQSCVDGYRMIKSEIPVACAPVKSALAPRALYRETAREPLYTGSINRELPANAARPDNAPGAVTTSPSGQTCVGGYSYRETAANGWTLPMRCD